MGRNNGKSIGSSGHAGGTRPGQTRKKPKDLSTHEREERGCGGVRCEWYFNEFLLIIKVEKRDLHLCLFIINQ